MRSKRRTHPCSLTRIRMFLLPLMAVRSDQRYALKHLEAHRQKPHRIRNSLGFVLRYFTLGKSLSVRFRS